MSLPIREYLAQRRLDVQASIKALRAELAEIDAAEKALEAVSGEPVRPRRERGTSGTGKKTLKELAIEVLQDHPEGLEAAAILEEIKKRHGIEVRRESMSPQLSRLGQDGVLTRDGLTWTLVQNDWLGRSAEAQKNETPDAATSGASYREERDDLADLLG